MWVIRRDAGAIVFNGTALRKADSIKHAHAERVRKEQPIGSLVGQAYPGTPDPHESVEFQLDFESKDPARRPSMSLR